MRQNGLEGWGSVMMVFLSSGLFGEVVGFRTPVLLQRRISRQQQLRQPKTTTTSNNMMMSPHDVLDSFSSLIQHTHEHQASVSDAQTSVDSMLSHWEALLSTLYTPGLLQPAHEHTQPLFGPPDPYLSAGRSIAPHVQNMVDMGLSGNNNYIDKANSEVVQQLPEVAQRAMSKGWNVIDGSNLQFGGKYGDNILPGFLRPGTLLPEHSPFVPPETPETFVAQVEWSANYLNVIDKLPDAAFAYVLIEFFILRPGIDIYKEDIKGSGTMVADTVAVVSVRLLAFAIIGIVTFGIFG